MLPKSIPKSILDLTGSVLYLRGSDLKFVKSLRIRILPPYLTLLPILNFHAWKSARSPGRILNFILKKCHVGNATGLNGNIVDQIPYKLKSLKLPVRSGIVIVRSGILPACLTLFWTSLALFLPDSLSDLNSIIIPGLIGTIIDLNDSFRDLEWQKS